MNIVLDTNVFVSGVFFPGPPSRILKAWRDKTIQIVLSREILKEYRRVGAELSSQYPPIDILPIIELIVHKALIIDAAPLIPLFSPPVSLDWHRQDRTTISFSPDVRH